jgi:hypothetical protein
MGGSIGSSDLGHGGRNALVAAMATDTWKNACKAAVLLWRRVHPDRTAVIEAELTEVRGEVLEQCHVA